MVEDEHPLRTNLPLQKLLDLLVIHGLDPLFVFELLLLADVLDELEARGVEGEVVFFLLVTGITDNDIMWLGTEVVTLLALRWVVDVRVGRLVGRGVRNVVVQGGRDIVWCENCDGHL